MRNRSATVAIPLVLRTFVTSPPKGGRSLSIHSARHPLLFNRGTTPCILPISPLGGEMPGRAEGGVFEGPCQ
ncbi:hypothetical protein DTW90_03410 [Neorhizobium sp. P12A]|nr:hypothetical protein DTW90_03410 [Neorhizobium sp. P12A]